MAQPFLGQLLLVGFNFNPQGWAFCNGSVLAISQNDALFALLGTTYGGDGQNTFNLPDLRGRTTIHAGSGGSTNYTLGETGGAEVVTLTSNQMPQHTHLSACSSVSQSSNDPTGGVPAVTADNRYGVQPPSVAMGTTTIGTMGGSQPHLNLQPYLVLNWIIALAGIFPTRN